MLLNNTFIIIYAFKITKIIVYLLDYSKNNYNNNSCYGSIKKMYLIQKIIIYLSKYIKFVFFKKMQFNVIYTNVTIINFNLKL